MIHIVLVNYNGTTDTIACLASLGRLQDGAITLTVVDNGSRQDQREGLQEWSAANGFVSALSVPGVPNNCPVHAGTIPGLAAPIPVTLVFSPDNLGFAGGNNIGLSVAVADPAMRYVWILNNDTEVEPDTLTALVRRMEDDATIGLCGSTLVYHDARDTVQALGGRFNVRLARPEQIAGQSPVSALPAREKVERELAYVVGASMLVSRAFVEEIGPMDEGYFLYFEELDWAARGRGRFRLGWAPDSIVFHKEGGAIGTSSRSRPSDLSLYYLWRSTLRYLRLHRPALVPLGIARLTLKAGRYMAGGDRRAAIVMARALVHSVQGRAGKNAMI